MRRPYSSVAVVLLFLWQCICTSTLQTERPHSLRAVGFPTSPQSELYTYLLQPLQADQMLDNL